MGVVGRLYLEGYTRPVAVIGVIWVATPVKLRKCCMKSKRNNYFKFQRSIEGWLEFIELGICPICMKKRKMASIGVCKQCLKETMTLTVNNKMA